MFMPLAEVFVTCPFGLSVDEIRRGGEVEMRGGE